jgi:hypothetical protein
MPSIQGKPPYIIRTLARGGHTFVVRAATNQSAMRGQPWAHARYSLQARATTWAIPQLTMRVGTVDDVLALMYRICARSGRHAVGGRPRCDAMFQRTTCWLTQLHRCFPMRAGGPRAVAGLSGHSQSVSQSAQAFYIRRSPKQRCRHSAHQSRQPAMMPGAAIKSVPGPLPTAHG